MLFFQCSAIKALLVFTLWIQDPCHLASLRRIVVGLIERRQSEKSQIKKKVPGSFLSELVANYVLQRER